MNRPLRCLAALAALAPAFAPAAEPNRPNVLFIAVDDLRPEFGPDGPARAPNLGRLAARGLTFGRAYCQQAVCSPSRTSLLTGCRPDTTKVWDLETHFRVALPDVVALPEHFKRNGYVTRGLGKIYHPGFNDERSWSTPWSTESRRIYARPENQALVQAGSNRVAVAKKAGRPVPRGSRGPAYESADVPDSTYTDGAVADRAVEILGRLKEGNRPFFFALGFARPHLPFVAPKRYWDLYDPAKIRLAANPFRPKDAPDYAVGPGGEMRAYHGIPAGPIPDALARTLKHGYYASISYMDAQLGRVLDELDRLGLRDNTIVVLWGDHGWKLGEHDGWCKHTNVELDARAPLILSAPGMAAGKTTPALVEFVDVYPTLAELAGLPLPAHLEGTSLAPLLIDPARPWKRAAFSQYPRAIEGRRLMGYSMRTDRHRFTRWVDRSDPSKVDAVELYDHQTDPAENQNIAADPANAELVARLTKEWQEGWREAIPPRP